jgi:hypothetical protein
VVELTSEAPRARLVALRHEGIRLDGLLSEPGDPSSRRVAVLHIHGRGSNFYTRPGSTILAGFPDPGVAHLSLNLRGHDLAYTDIPWRGADPGRQEDYEVAGAMWERTVDSAADIGIGVRALRERGYSHVFVAAHSAGALALATYAAREHGLAGRVLLSPLTSGKGSVARWFGDERGVEEAATRARQMVAQGRGHLLIPVDQWYYAISATSLLDRVDEPDDVWRRAMEADHSPCLMVWGTAESRAAGWQQAYEGLNLPTKRAVPIPGAGHYYVGFEDQVTRAVADFVAAVAPYCDR